VPLVHATICLIDAANITSRRDSVVFLLLSLCHKGVHNSKVKAMSVRKRRLEKGWSQEELARHSGLSTRTIQRIEGGRKAGLESLKCLAAVFETSMSALMQEQTMTDQEQADQSKKPMINKIEREAIEFAQSLLKGPKKGQADPLSKIEREAIDYARNLLSKFKT